MRASLVLAAALLLAPAPCLAQSPLDALLGLRVGSRPTASGPHGATQQEALAALRAAGLGIPCAANVTWVSDEAGVETAQCTGTVQLRGHPAMLVLDFVRYRLPGVPRTEMLDRVSLSSHQDSGFGAWVRRDLERRFGRPQATNGPDRRWHDGRSWVVLDDPSNQPCGGLCVPTLWIHGDGSPVAGRFGFP